MREEDLKDLEKKLWDAANKMIGAVSVANYKFVVLGLIFLKYISDSFEEKYREFCFANKDMYLYWLAGSESGLGIPVEKFSPDYSKTALLAINNCLYCEPHLELLRTLSDMLSFEDIEDLKKKYPNSGGIYI